MSSQDDDEPTNDTELTDRVVTDSVHSRFRSIQVHCDVCNIDIVGKRSAIEKHFDSSHPSKERCCYCKGKVFAYTQIPDDGSTEPPKTIVYHKCNKS